MKTTDEIIKQSLELDAKHVRAVLALALLQGLNKGGGAVIKAMADGLNKTIAATDGKNGTRNER